MNVLLIGSGGREHAIALKIAESRRLRKLYCITGNPGISKIAEIVDIGIDEIDKIIDFSVEKSINLIICGPEMPLVNGLADKAEEKNIPVFGPKLKGAMLEGSKIYAKKFMDKYNIPTSPYISFVNPDKAKEYITKKLTFPIVIKADGLAAGKGVKIANDKNEAMIILEQFMISKTLGEAGNKIIIEDFMLGEEMSIFYITDSKTFLTLLPAKDYKKAYDNDQGENTGGMGSYAPHNSLTKSLNNKIEEQILNRIKIGFKKENIDYRGVLYVGIMITDEGPKVLEFNCRFGDPETQVLLPLIKNDLLEIMYAAAKGKLESHSIKWKNDYAACVVIASGGYPEEYNKNHVINFKISPYDFIHAGTKFNGNNIITNGGRVLNAVALGASKTSALKAAYRLAEQVDFEACFYRKDIGN